MYKEKVLSEILDFLHQTESIILRKHELIFDASINEDIDILMEEKNEGAFFSLLKKYGFRRKIDPKIFNIYLYGSTPHYHYKSRKHDLHFDVIHNLSVQSTFDIKKPGYRIIYWIPLDREIQSALWVSKKSKKINGSNVFGLDPLFELVHILSHIIFDKKGTFEHAYLLRISELIKQVDLEKLEYYLRLVFFGYAETLVHQCLNDELENIYKNYISFKDY